MSLLIPDRYVGDCKDPFDYRRVIYHEAGHAVITLVLGEEVIKLEIGREWEYERPGGTQRRREWRWDVDCLITRAGEVAERCFLAGPTNPDHWADDRQLIDTVLASAEGRTITGFQDTEEWKDAYKHDVAQRAETLLRRPDIIQAVEALAERLLTLRRISEAQVTAGQAIPKFELLGDEVKQIVEPLLKR